MKILKLRFKNLNSLAGEWEVDFSHPDYTETGIFAITGPTGAGKTTILDAIALALYGKTPRLDKISKSENEIITRQTGECFAEVEFETNKGSFRAHWSQRRSRGNADGALQQSQHEIADLITGEVLENKIKNVLEKVEEVTGLDFARFTRSILLAQGSFAAFLKANSNERSEILEQITGTDIYSEISIKVHERNTAEKKKLDELQAFLGGLQLLGKEELDALKKDIESKNTDIQEVSVKKKESDTALGWLHAITKLEGELKDLEEAKKKHQKEKEKSAPDLEKLALGKRAQRLDAEYTNLKVKRDLENKENKRLDKINEELPGKQECLGKLKANLEQLTSKTEEKREGLDKERKTWVKVRELDTQIKKQHNDIKEFEKTEKALLKDKKELGETLQKLSEDISENQKEHNQLDLYLSENEQDEKIASLLSGLKQLVGSYLENKSAMETKENELSLANKSISKAEKEQTQKETVLSQEKEKLQQAETVHSTASEKLEAHLDGDNISTWRDTQESLSERSTKLEQLEKLVHSIDEETSELAEIEKQLEENTPLISSHQSKLEEYIKDEDQLSEKISLLETNLLLANKVKDLEEERQRLTDKTPCPLCGSLDHPYAKGDTPQIDQEQTQLSDAKEAYKKAQNLRIELDKKLELLEQECKQLQTNHDKFKTSISANEATFQKDREELSLPRRYPERVSMIEEAKVECNRQLQTLKNKVTEGEKLQKAFDEAKSTLQQCKDNLTTAKEELKDAKHQHTTLQNNKKTVEERIEALQQSLGADLETITRQVTPFEVTLTDLNTMVSTLEKRSSEYIDTTDKKTTKEKEITKLKGNQEKEQTRLEGVEASLKTLLGKISNETTQLEEQQSTRKDLYGTKDPDSEEKCLESELKTEEHNEKLITKEFTDLDKDVNTLISSKNGLESSLKELKSQIQELSTTFAKQLTTQKFTDESAFLLARLTAKDLDALTALENSLQKKEQQLNTQWNDRQQSLLEEKEKSLTDKSVEELTETAQELSGSLDALLQSKGAIQGQLDNQEELGQKQVEKLAEIEKQQAECTRWGKLHNLIGSADGKKFRNFAQGLTFDLMISHANTQLQKMTDRYILLRDDNDPLELNVIDNYQAGVIRSTKNLSGGESFIASLALALGLSQMASRNVRVDSLFLDEGFGTLDEETLETALDTLAGLHQDGKLIGVISHVPAIKERITTQIQVEMIRNGKSRLTGAGIK
jgi:DNA repair protein SbcC/Rad50